MAIYRVTERSQYTVIDQELLDDMDISMAAKGLLVYLVGRPDDWRANVTHLAKAHGVGRKTIRKYLTELQAAGYIEVSQEKAPSGKFRAVIYDVIESPNRRKYTESINSINSINRVPQMAQNHIEADSPPAPVVTWLEPDFAPAHRGPENRVPQNGEAVNGEAVLGSLIIKDLTSKEINQSRSYKPSSVDEVVEALPDDVLIVDDSTSNPVDNDLVLTEEIIPFAMFWAIWPRKVGKAAAIKAWAKLKPDSIVFNQISENLEAQCSAGDWARDNYRYCPHPATYINGRRWEDVVLAPQSAVVAQSNAEFKSAIDGIMHRMQRST